MIKYFLPLLALVFWLHFGVVAQDIFIETSIPETKKPNFGARINVYNYFNSNRTALGFFGRFHQFYYKDKSEPVSGSHVKTREISLGAGLRYDMIHKKSFILYVFPYAEISSIGTDEGIGLGSNLGIEKKLSYPISLSFETGFKNRTFMYDFATKSKSLNPLSIFIAAGMAISIRENTGNRSIYRSGFYKRGSSRKLHKHINNSSF